MRIQTGSLLSPLQPRDREAATDTHAEVSKNFSPNEAFPANFAYFFKICRERPVQGDRDVLSSDHQGRAPRSGEAYKADIRGFVCGEIFTLLEITEMKKTKKLATLMLALVMALSCMTMPAMASDISPRWLACWDRECGGRTVQRTTYEDGEIYLSASCNALNSSILHHHCKRTYTVSRYCVDCHKEIIMDTYTRTYCASENREF